MTAAQLADVILGWTNSVGAGFFYWLETGPFWLTIPAFLTLPVVMISTVLDLTRVVDFGKLPWLPALVLRLMDVRAERRDSTEVAK